MTGTNHRQIDLHDRLVIELGLSKGDSFRRIGRLLGRHPTTISNEVWNNRLFIEGSYINQNDCKHATVCYERGLCAESGCFDYCARCKRKDCTEICGKYSSAACKRHYRYPYVCNTCNKRRTCTYDRYFYSAKHADQASKERRSSSRSHIRISDKDLEEINALFYPLVKKGQPLAHIHASNEQRIPVTLRSIYNYIERGELSVNNLDLRRKVRYKKRRKPRKPIDHRYRLGRTYLDFLEYMRSHPDASVVEMDTVKGKRGSGSCLLTMIFRKSSVMLLFLLPNCKAESVLSVFDYLEYGLDLNTFAELFEVILTDNGSEFKMVQQLEFTADLKQRTHVFYCDPMASWQKPHIEKNHEYIRYVIPKGKSFDYYTQKDISMLANHINSTARPSLQGDCPYEMVSAKDTDMNKLMQLLDMYQIPADKIVLTPALLH